MWIKCTDNSYSWRIANVYGLQESQCTDEETERWFYQLEKEYATCSNEPVIIIGDFNAHVGSDELGIKGNSHKVNRNGRKLRDLIERRNLSIINNSDVCKGLWTRVCESSKAAIDLAICNEAMMNKIKCMEIDEERVNVLTRIKKENGKYVEVPSDHNTITLQIESVKVANKSKEIRWNVSNIKDQRRFKNLTENIIMNEQWEEGGNLNSKV